MPRTLRACSITLIAGAVLCCFAGAERLAAQVSPARTPDPTLPTEGLSRLIDWVDKLVRSFDQIAAREDRKRLIRDLDRLNRNLAKLEIDKRAFINGLPKQDPDTALIQEQFADLTQSMLNISDAVGQLGAGVGGSEGQQGMEVDASLQRAVGSGGAAMIQASLDYKHYDAAAVKAAGERGLKVVDSARVAVERLLNRMRQTPPR